MNLEEYREHRKRTMNHNLNIPLQRLNAALGLGESGEIQDLIKKEVFHEHPEDPYKVLDEAGDIIFYLDWLLDTYDWTFEAAMHANVAKLQKRYPNGFDAERSRNRNREEESESVQQSVHNVARNENL